jgi:hypothetical protein
MDVSIIWTAASCAAASASMIRSQPIDGAALHIGRLFNDPCLYL